MEEAEHAVLENEALQRRFGELACTVTVQELVEARSAKDYLEGTGVSLVEAARQVKAALEKAQESRTVKEGLDAYHTGIWERFQERKKENPRTQPRHWRGVKGTIARLGPIHHLSLREVTGEKLRSCLSGSSKHVLKSHLRNLHAAFEFCIDSGWMDENPSRALNRMRPDKSSKARSVQTFTVEEVRRFLLVVAEEDSRAIPYFAICFFAGVRPEAAFKITWADVGQNGYIYVPHTANKSGHAYNVKILPVLARWLNWWEAQGQIRAGLVVPFSTSTLKRIRKNAMTKAGMTRWVQDVTRKTFATAHRGAFKCKVLTSAALGHKGTTVLDEHYDSRLMTEDEAAEYWNILPPESQPQKEKEAA
jgi:integrase